MSLVYRASPQTWQGFLLSLLSMTFIFLLALFYLLLVPLLFYLCYTSIYFWIVVCIIVSTIFWPHSTEHISWWRENRFFEAWRSYFQLHVYSDEDTIFKSKHKKTLYTFVPHGLFPFGLTLVSGLLFKNEDVKIAVASNMFYIPIFGFLLRVLGCVEANKDIFTKYDRVVLIPDGIAGAFYSDRTHERLFLGQRKGFLRHAAQEGFVIIPVYCFGHTQLYDVYGLRELSRRLRFTIIFFCGRKPTIWLPHARPVSIVFGKTIVCKENVDETHANYLYAIRELYDYYKFIVPEWDKEKEIQII